MDELSKHLQTALVGKRQKEKHIKYIRKIKNNETYEAYKEEQRWWLLQVHTRTAW